MTTNKHKIREEIEDNRMLLTLDSSKDREESHQLQEETPIDNNNLDGQELMKSKRWKNMCQIQLHQAFQKLNSPSIKNTKMLQALSHTFSTRKAKWPSKRWKILCHHILRENFHKQSKVSINKLNRVRIVVSWISAPHLMTPSQKPWRKESSQISKTMLSIILLGSLRSLYVLKTPACSMAAKASESSKYTTPSSTTWRMLVCSEVLTNLKTIILIGCKTWSRSTTMFSSLTRLMCILKHALCQHTQVSSYKESTGR